MLIKELIDGYKAAGRRYHIVGTETDGIIIALDVEGRIFAFKDGKILNRVNADAIAGISTRAGYINPGGDGFWPAPEGSRMGFEYSSGEWRVPPSLTNARWLVAESNTKSEGDFNMIGILNSDYGASDLDYGAAGPIYHGLFTAEVDLVNAAGTGMPFIFSRDVNVCSDEKHLYVEITEGIEYIGNREVPRDEAVIAPWSLCQFDCGKDCTLRLPKLAKDEYWDLYPWDSSCHRKETEDAIEVEMVTDFRFQLALSPAAKCVEFIDRGRGFSVLRLAKRLDKGLDYIAIDDIDYALPCNNRPVRFSAYCDPSGFMEIEACGGTPARLSKGVKTTVEVINSYILL